MMAEQQRLRTVSGGLESLSVWDDSETERRFRRLRTERTERTGQLTLDAGGGAGAGMELTSLGSPAARSGRGT